MSLDDYPAVRAIADEHAARTLAAIAVATIDAVVVEMENYEWQEPCSDQYDKGYARGYENAMHAAAANLREATGAGS